ncbi:MAG: hypothetical protein M1480_18035 [Bacteroidetes bacterium]|nr:hypothetical protein [Bacteroidota bacterium]
MKVIFSVIALIFFAGITGCVSNKKIVTEKSVFEQNIPPGQCRVEAQVMKIDSLLSGNSGNDPCSKSPCIAWIKIKNIIGYGAGSSTLNIGDTLKTKFAFTLAPTTKEIFPKLIENLPGLTEGSSFEADIQLLPSNPSSKNKEKIYLIYGYERIN